MGTEEEFLALNIAMQDPLGGLVCQWMRHLLTGLL
jgi:hypothetical protein